MKIGLFGGSFNPIHNGHIELAAAVREHYNLDRILFIPAGNPYQKNQKDMLPPDMRARLVIRAIEPFEWAEVWLGEVKRCDKPSYTADTLLELKTAFPQHEFYLILGADSLVNILSWHNPTYLFKNSHIIVAGRGTQIEEQTLRQIITDFNMNFMAHITYFPFENTLSSTKVRDAFQTGKDYKFYVPHCVYVYLESIKKGENKYE